MNKKYLFIFLILILLPLAVDAKVYHTKLLTVESSESDEGPGGTADAFLEIKSGKGRIFLDSFPLTKIDTQISTRYANKVACDYLEANCNNKDFFYTIRADSAVVGGPSASASLTVLTIAALEGLNLNPDVVMTGTINSGGSIGPVGGISRKVEAANKLGLKKALVPLFSPSSLPDVNLTINNTGDNSSWNIVKRNLANSENKNLSIEVVYVGDVGEALYHFTGKNISYSNGRIKVPRSYELIMSGVADNLCQRSFILYDKLNDLGVEIPNSTIQSFENINSSFSKKEYYSAASYCFSMGLSLRNLLLEDIENRNPEKLKEIFNTLGFAIRDFDKNLSEKKLETIPDLESYVIVKERIGEAAQSLVDMRDNITASDLSYSLERYYSAVFWSEFFKMPGPEVVLDKQLLKEACVKKISEAEERMNYAKLYVPFLLEESNRYISQAYTFKSKENYEMCLFKASFSKARSNILLSTVSVSQEKIDELADAKLEALEKVLSRQSSRGFFPILGYSYYEYSSSLLENNNTASAIVFAEYGLELSDIGMYFPEEKLIQLPYFTSVQIMAGISIFFVGAFCGVYLIFFLAKKEQKKKVTKR
jgi:predicted S18 family serine protease